MLGRLTCAPVPQSGIAIDLVCGSFLRFTCLLGGGR
jgi:hypothetical protein